MEFANKMSSPEIIIQLAKIDAKISGLQREMDHLKELKSRLGAQQAKIYLDIPNAPIKLYDAEEIKHQLVFNNFECRDDLKITANRVLLEYGSYRRHITIHLPFTSAMEIKDHGFIYFDGENCLVELNLSNNCSNEIDHGKTPEFMNHLIENHFVDQNKIAKFFDEQ